MKTYFLISILIIALFSCKNASNGVAAKKEVLYDTIAVYDKNTGEHIRDTIVYIDSEKNMNNKPSDTIPIIFNGNHIGDSVLSSHTFIPAKQDKKN